MAFNRLISLPLSLLVLSTLVVFAFAADYGYNGIPADSPQAKSAEYGDSKPNYGEKPSAYKPNSEGKPGYDNKPVYGSKPEGEAKPKYGTNQYNYKPKEEEKEKSGYDQNKPYVVKSKPGYDTTKPDSYKPKPEVEEKPEYVKKQEGEKKPNYGTNQHNYKPKEEVKEKSGYDQNKPYVVKSKPGYDATKPDIYKPKPEKEKPYSVAVEGFVYCKTPSSHYPIPRSLAKVTCEAVDEVGVEKTVPICSVKTDANGYFYATVSSLNDSNLKLKDCKAFLESSPEPKCNVPTDVNKGITGFPISGDVYRVLNDKHTKLYSAQPFFYTSETKSVPNGY
ncbi:hypothetical protein PTKIN_Ptkin14bG0218000 [Pterospermum kingtungense]